jgi:WhiB family redox-sensing transcriptional regulator
VIDLLPSVEDGLLEALVPPCTDAPDQFFSEVPEELEQAKVLCRVCPVRTACLDAALDRREPWGVWGGEVFDRGRIIARKRGPGRPRKQTILPTVELVPPMREPLEVSGPRPQELAASVA